MPQGPELVLAAIGIMATTAIALLLAPTFLWLRRRLFPVVEPDREQRAEGMLDPKAVASEGAWRANATGPSDA